MTLFFASHQITIYRPKTLSAGKWAFSATFTGYSADIQPVASERAEPLGGRIGKVFQAWVDDTVEVKEGDQIVSVNKNGSQNRYSVRTVSTYQGAGLLDYKELILMAQDDDN